MVKIVSINLVTVLVCLAGVLSGTSSAATIKANSCNYAHVNTAVSSANNGDTILVPGGTCDWGSSTLTTTKAISLVAAGPRPRITGSGVLISVNTGATSGNFPFRLSGFSFAGVGNYIVLSGAGNGWRIDNNTFGCNGSVNCRVSITTPVPDWGIYGLIDNNVFDLSGIAAGGNNVAAEALWQADAQWSTGQALFIENNTFNLVNNVCAGTAYNSIDSNNGARLTIRYNTFNDAFVDSHSACQTSVRGARSMEIYNNTFNRTCAVFGGYVGPRGGTVVVTGNVVAGVWTPGAGSVKIDNRRSWWDSGCTLAGCFGSCDGGNAYDGNLANAAHGGAVDGWPCMDQTGRGKQTGVMGSGGTQASDPAYIWNNVSGRICLSGSSKYGVCTSDADCPGGTCSTQVNTPNSVYLHNNTNNQPYHIVSGRDYFSGVAKAGYSTYTCPHPLAGAGTCNVAAAGRQAYTVSGTATRPRSPSDLRKR